MRLVLFREVERAAEVVEGDLLRRAEQRVDVVEVVLALERAVRVRCGGETRAVRYGEMWGLGSALVDIVKDRLDAHLMKDDEG